MHNSSSNHLCDIFTLTVNQSAFSAPTTADTIALTAILAVALLAVISARLPPNSPMSLRHLCIFCPLVAAKDGDGEDAMTSNGDDNYFFLPKFPNQSFETALTGATSFDEAEAEINTQDPSLQIKSNESSVSTIRQGNLQQYHLSSLTKMTRVKVSIPLVEETSHDPTEEVRRDDLTEKENLNMKEDEGWYNIECASRYECNDDDQSDASDLTMPSFRPGQGDNKENKNRRKRSLPTSKMLQKVQKAIYTTVQTLRSKNKRSSRTKHANNGVDPTKGTGPSCSCLILLMEPASHTFEILPISYIPGVSFVSDLLEQIPLQSSFNFRLRFQNYSGLMALDAGTTTVTQLAQSKPVPMRYSCEFQYYETQQQQDRDRTNADTIVPPLLVAILPEQPSIGESALEITEKLARKLLSVTSVRKRLEFLQDMMISSSLKEEEEEEVMDVIDGEST
ncbi:hypothetical protein IV203_021116 [Nitzschia inconspicua]|uniref:Uncharacterized protein n=1 Tax=Nitzschia inconspicua TaxID=303405 RepID=A0A9K3KHA3_9STRA|nr:hypothetical protein IV203_021116 [Nitzschia inconspicua]